MRIDKNYICYRSLSTTSTANMKYPNEYIKSNQACPSTQNFKYKVVPYNDGKVKAHILLKQKPNCILFNLAQVKTKQETAVNKVTISILKWNYTNTLDWENLFSGLIAMSSSYHYLLQNR